MNDPVAVTVSPRIALAGPDKVVRTREVSPGRSSLKMRSPSPSQMRSRTPTKFRSLSPTKFMKQVQRFASPARRRSSAQDNNDNSSSRNNSNNNNIRNSSPFKAQTRQRSLTPLHRLAKHRLWEEIMGILQYEPEKEIAQWLQQCQTHHKSPMLGGSALHVVLFYYPPLPVVNKLIAALVRMGHPQAVPEDSIDPVREQTPLHVAVAMGCDFNVIERLTTRTAAQTVDIERRMPLHWACTARPQPNRQVLQLLVQTYPAARRVKDEFAFTPLMIAQYKRAPVEICELLLPSTFLHPATTMGRVSNPPEDLPLEVMLGKSMGDISCLHMDGRFWESKIDIAATTASTKEQPPTKPTATAAAPVPPTCKAFGMRERRSGKRPKNETKIASDSGHSKSSSSSSSKKSIHRKIPSGELYQTVEL